MKKLIVGFVLFVMFIGVLAFGAHIYAENVPSAAAATPQKNAVVNLDKVYRVHNAVYDGHEYLLFESGERGDEGYAFFLDHKADCKVCCEQFD